MPFLTFHVIFTYTRTHTHTHNAPSADIIPVIYEATEPLRAEAAHQATQALGSGLHIPQSPALLCYDHGFVGQAPHLSPGL